MMRAMDTNSSHYKSPADSSAQLIHYMHVYKLFTPACGCYATHNCIIVVLQSAHTTVGIQLHRTRQTPLPDNKIMSYVCLKCCHTVVDDC